MYISDFAKILPTRPAPPPPRLLRKGRETGWESASVKTTAPGEAAHLR